MRGRLVRTRPRLEVLEARTLLCGGHDHLLASEPAMTAIPAVLTAVASGTGPAAAQSLFSLPQLSSLPGAKAKLYLDFDGDFEAQWGTATNITTPAYDQDGDPTTFSDGELANIQQTWQRVAEDYSPFNIDVTTTPPADMSHGAALKVVVGGDASWIGFGPAGVAFVNSFSDPTLPNIVFAFPKNSFNGYPQYTAAAISHEAGHGFGLEHQSQYDAAGNKTAEYAPGTGDGTDAIMGGGPGAPVPRWWYGPNAYGATYIQDDMAVIAGPTNGFGYRTQTYGGSSPGAAVPLSASGSQVTASGVIKHPTDRNYYAFTTPGGPAHLEVDVPPDWINTLFPKLELYDATGALVGSATGNVAAIPNWIQGTSTAFINAVMDATLPAGTYTLVVSGTGGYGNVGTYTVNGTVVSPVNEIAAPTGLVAVATSTSRVDLSWTDNATNEAGYSVERSTDGVTWVAIAPALPADSIHFTDTTAVASTTYSYRVAAFNDTAPSASSNVASVTTPPPVSLPEVPDTPGNLTAETVSATTIRLTWTASEGAAGYAVERTTDGIEWTPIATTPGSTSDYTDSGLDPGTRYRYRVRAFNGEGAYSPYSVIVSAMTLVHGRKRRPPARHGGGRKD